MWPISLPVSHSVLRYECSLYKLALKFATKKLVMGYPTVKTTQSWLE